MCAVRLLTLFCVAALCHRRKTSIQVGARALASLDNSGERIEKCEHGPLNCYRQGEGEKFSPCGICG